MGMIPLLVSPPLQHNKPDEPINGLTCGQCINYSYRAKRKEFLVRYDFLMLASLLFVGQLPVLL